MHEAFYEDSEGRIILVITELDAWVMCNKFANGLKNSFGTAAAKEAPPIEPRKALS